MVGAGGFLTEGRYLFEGSAEINFSVFGNSERQRARRIANRGCAMMRRATMSDDGIYRYDLTRVWDRAKNRLCFVMLNPSTADSMVDDPTIRRCGGFAHSWGYGSIVVVNLFALRVTRPIHLNDHPDPVGPLNDDVAGFWIRRLPVIAAWGAHKKTVERVEWFGEQIALNDHPVRCLGTTKDGHPRHPLYVPASKAPEGFILERGDDGIE
jgi:hypothetical protein